MTPSAGSPEGAGPATGRVAQEPDGAAAAERGRLFFMGLSRFLLETVDATLGPALLLGLVASAAWLAGISSPAREAVALIAAIPLLWRLAGAIPRGLFRPRDARHRLVPCDDATARHLYRWVRVIGRLFAVFAPLAWALEANHYPRGAIDGIWLAFEALTLVAAILLFARRGTFRAVVPRATTRLGGAVRGVLAFLYPILAIYVIALLALDALGYGNLARYLGWSTAISAAIVLVATLVSKYATYRLEGWNERRVAALAAGGGSRDEVEPQIQQQRGFYHTLHAFARFAVISVAGVALLAAWGLDHVQMHRLVAERFLIGWDTPEGRIGITILDLFECAFILIMALLGGRIARALARRRLRGHATLDRGTQEALANLGYFLVVAVGAYFVLSTLHVNLEAVKWIGGAVGLGIGFGLQNIVNNLVSGIILLVEKPIRTDDVVEVAGVVGRVDQIGTRATVVIDNDNIARIIPNSDFVSGAVTNWSYGDPRTRIRCPVAVAYGTDAHTIRQMLVEIAAGHGLVVKRPGPDVMFRRFGDNAPEFELVCYTDEPARIPRIQSDLNYAIDAAFRKHGIQIPFPQRDVHIVQKEPLTYRVVHERRRAGKGDGEARDGEPAKAAEAETETTKR